MKTVWGVIAGLAMQALSGGAAEPLIVGHRGASRDAPENTLPAFELAWKQGADAIEGDFLLSKDGHIVCLHDTNTKRVSGRALRVKETDFAQLQGLDVGRYRGAQFAGTRVPSIAEVLATVPEGKKVYLEMKSGKEIVPALKKAVENSRLKASQVVVICFDAEVIAEVKRVMPEVTANWLCKVETDRLGRRKNSAAVILKTLARIKADGVSTGTKGVSEELIKAVKKGGYGYHVWTVNEVALAQKFRAWGVDSITTDVPEVIRRGLE